MSGCAAPGPPPTQGKVARSKMTKWRVLALVGVHGLFALHLWHLYTRGETLSPLEPSEAMQLADRSIVNAGLIFFAFTILLTLVFGRFFCGWACHLLALQDLCLALLLKLGLRPDPLRSRALLIVPLVAALYMFAYPLAYRLWTGIGPDFQGVELTTRDFWETFPHPAVAVATFVVCGFVIVYFMGSKGFCTYACPYGAIFAATDKLAPGKIRVNDDCDQCGHCTVACTSNVAVAQEVRDWGMVTDPGCMKCMDCVSVCPTNALSFGFGAPTLGAAPRRAPAPARPRQLPWEELLLAGAFAVGFFSLRGVWLMDSQRMPFLFALGCAGILAVVVLTVVRLFTRRRFAFQRVTLVREGERTRAGNLVLGTALPLLVLWGHTGLVRYHEWRADDLMAELEPRTRSGLAAPPLDASSVDAVASRALAQHADWLHSWALVEGAPNTVRRAWSRLWSGDRAAAEELAQEALARGSGGVVEALLLGELALARGDVATAEERYAALHAARPDLPDVLGPWLPLLVERGRTEQALAAIERTLVYHPDHVLLLLQHASVSMVLGRLESVEPTLRRAIAADPRRPEPRAMLEQFLAQRRALEGR